MHRFRDDNQKMAGAPPGLQAIVVGILLSLYILVGAFSINGKSKTVDENAHYLYGRNILLNSDATRFDDSKMPVTALNALPRKIARSFAPGKVRSFLNEFMVARLVTLLFSSCIALVLYVWSRSLYGFIPAIFSLLLYLLDPNILAHSQLVTTDIYAAGTTVFVFFFLWQFAHRRTLLNGLLCSLSLGVSLIAKYSAVVLIPLALFTIWVFDSYLLRPLQKNGQFSKYRRYLRNYLVYLTVALFVSIVVINISFLSDRSFTRLSAYRFQSDFFRTLQLVPNLGNLPVPLPYPYLEGLDLVLYNEHTGASYGNIYLLGKTRPGNERFIGYFFIASLFKVPIVTQVIYLSAIYVYLRDRQRRKNFWLYRFRWEKFRELGCLRSYARSHPNSRASIPPKMEEPNFFKDEIFLFVPVFFFALYYNFFFNTQIGIRYYLVVFPLLYVFSGQLFKNFDGFSTSKKVFVLGSMSYLLLSVLSYYPNFLPYFNEIVWDRSQAYQFLADSNIDWGQNSEELEEYLSLHSDAVYAPQGMQSGHIVISVNQLTGVQGTPETYRWLREHFQPVGTLSYTYLVYKIRPDEIVQLCNNSENCDGSK